MFGSGSPEKEEDLPSDSDSEIPDMESSRKRVPEKTQVLMEELFRAKLDRVQRVNPKTIQ